jgi:hypothetical protein
VNIETQIHIHATPEKVWGVLTDFDKYSDWNPFVKSLTGEVAVGNQITVALLGMAFKPIILKFEKNKELRWLGKLLFKGLFDGEHYFILQENKADTTTFIHGENFDGVLVGLFKKKLLTETIAGFEAMNEALKVRVEGGD